MNSASCGELEGCKFATLGWQKLHTRHSLLRESLIYIVFSYSWGLLMSEASKYVRPAVLPEIPDSRKKARIYPLWAHRFMSGPETWLIAAYSISPTAQWVGLILWQQWRLNRGKQPLKLTGRMLCKFGVSKFKARRVLNALEKAGLITMQRFKHRSPLITIVGG
jgi:hypothetical protein